MSNLLLSLVLQIKVKRGVHLEDTEEVSQCQSVWIGDHPLGKRLHDCSGTEEKALERRQEDDQLNREEEKSRNLEKYDL